MVYLLVCLNMASWRVCESRARSGGQVALIVTVTRVNWRYKLTDLRDEPERVHCATGDRRQSEENEFSCLEQMNALYAKRIACCKRSKLF